METRDHMLASLEKRWKAADQDILILAVFLNPYLRAHCFNRATLSLVDLFNIAKRIFTRLFKAEPLPEFTQALADYAEGRGEFSITALALEDFSKEAQTRSKVNTSCSHILNAY